MMICSSVMRALLEGDAEAAAEIEGISDRVTTPIALLEALTSLLRTYDVTAAEARDLVKQLLVETRIRVVPITEDMAWEGLERYGRLRMRRVGPPETTCLLLVASDRHGGLVTRRDLGWPTRIQSGSEPDPGPNGNVA
jgi:uncharacterized protein with PIN domain